MPLPQPVARKPLHTRNILCEGYQRDDGLWDIEARLVDTKSYEFPNQDRGGVIRPGEALHDLSIRITLNTEMVIQQALSVSDFTPFDYCKNAGRNFDCLVGLQIAPGWMRRVQQCIGGTRGCTHLTEMLKTIATTAFQTMSYARMDNPREQAKPRHLDSCMSYASDSPVILRDWPDFYTGEK